MFPCYGAGYSRRSKFPIHPWSFLCSCPHDCWTPILHKVDKIRTSLPRLQPSITFA
jgi:hypothetical protein